jgi:putative peptidoglycan lipid II flippase
MIGHQLGADFESDIYFMSLTLTTIIFMGIGSSISTNIIPLIVKYRTDKENGEGISNIFNSVVILSILISILYVIFAPSIVGLLASGYSGEKLVMTIQLTRIMVPTAMFIMLDYFFVGVLQANERFILPAITSFPYNILFFIYIAVGIERHGVYGLALATTFGWLLQFSVLAPTIIKHKLIPMRWHVNLKDPTLKKYYLGVVPIIMVTLTYQFNIMMDNRAASGLGDGNVSAIYYGNMLFVAIVTTTVYGITAVMFPKFNKKYLEENKEGLFQSVINVLRSIILLLIPMSVGLIVIGPYVIGLIFERGVFDASDTATTVVAFTSYTSFMIAFGFLDVLNKAYYTMGIKKIPLFISGFITLINITLNSILVKQYGFAGIAIGTSIAFYLGAILSFIVFSKDHKAFEMGRFYNTLYKALVAALVMGVGVYTTNQLLLMKIELTTLTTLFVMGIDIFTGIVLYGITLLLVKEQLISNAYRQLKMKLKRS